MKGEPLRSSEMSDGEEGEGRSLRLESKLLAARAGWPLSTYHTLVVPADSLKKVLLGHVNKAPVAINHFLFRKVKISMLTYVAE